MKVVLCCLDGESMVDSRKDPVFVGITANWKHTTKLPSQHFRCTVFDCCGMPIVA